MMAISEEGSQQISPMEIELKQNLNAKNADTSQDLHDFLQETVMSDEWGQDHISDEELLEAVCTLEAQMTDELNHEHNSLNLDDVSQMIDNAVEQSDVALFDELLQFVVKE